MSRLTRKAGMVVATALSVTVVLLSTTVQAQDCPPCQEYEDWSVTSAKAQLAEAFRLSLDVMDCSSDANRTTCRQIDALLEDVLEAVDSIFTGHVSEAARECLTCDPGAHLWPIVDGIRALTSLLDEKGDKGFTDSRAGLVEKLEGWKRYQCPCSGTSKVAGPSPRNPKRSREAEARREITNKCGEKFAANRQGLLQVFRAPNDRDGCYQSRACRNSTVYKGFETQAGFWTYDGEYWYIWTERRGTSGRWITCDR